VHLGDGNVAAGSQWRRQNFSAAGVQPWALELRLEHLQKIMRSFLISSRSLQW